MPKVSETPKIFTSTSVRLANSTKHDGHTSFGHIDEAKTLSNISRFTANLGWPIKGYVFMRISYDDGRTYDDILLVRKPEEAAKELTRNASPITDAVITNLAGVCLLLPTADCYPVTLFDPEHKVLALAHMGWQSTAAHLIDKVIKMMIADFSTNPGELLVHLGAGIPADYYTFADPSQRSASGWRGHLKKVGNEFGINLLSYNLEQLSKLGVRETNIEVDPRNTVESDELESHHVHNKTDKPVARRFLTAVMFYP